MNFIIVAIKEIKQALRDKHSTLMMVIYPIALILILGTALSGVFENSITFKYNKILYKIEGEESKGFNEFLKVVGDLGIGVEQVHSEESALKKIEDASYSCYIDVNEEEGEIKLYKNNVYSFKGDLIQTILQSYIERYNVISEIAVQNPKAIGEILADNNINYVEEKHIEKDRKPRALDYYAVTMLTMIMMYGSLSGAFSIGSEYVRNTFHRVMASPVNKYEVLSGKVLGSVIATFLQGVIVILFTKYVFNTYWGENIYPIYLLILSQVIMSISLGVGIAFLTEKDTLTTSLLNIILPLITFLGGGYVPLEQFNNRGLNFISILSPLKWTNDGIFDYIYMNTYEGLSNAIIINFVIAMVFLGVSSLIYKKKVA